MPSTPAGATTWCSSTTRWTADNATTAAPGQQFGVAARVHYVHDVHLPTLPRHSRGVVVINGTVGLSALYHDKPLMVLGRALYDLPGLTFQGELAQFWSFQNRVDKTLWRRFRTYLITRTQLNGAFTDATSSL